MRTLQPGSIRSLFLPVLLTALSFASSFHLLAQTSSSVVVVKGTQTIAKLSSEARSVSASYTAAKDLLGPAVPFIELTDDDLAAGKLAGAKLAIFPCNEVLADDAVAAVRAFIEGGGKVIWCHLVPEALRPALDLADQSWIEGKSRGEFSEIRPIKRSPLGRFLPAQTYQRASGVMATQPAAGARVAAEWFTDRALPAKQPALIISPVGAVFTQILRTTDAGNKRRLLRGLVAYLLPDLAPAICRVALHQSQQLRNCPSIIAMEVGLRKAYPKGTPDDVSKLWNETQKQYRDCRQAINETDYGRSLGLSEDVRRGMQQLYCALAPGRASELRGTWMGPGWNERWQDIMQSLHDHGYNAVFPMMCDGGGAYYPSTVLPQCEDNVKDQRNYLTDCIRWGKHYGVEVHVRRVNWALFYDQPNYVQKMKDEGRTVKGVNLTKDGQIQWVSRGWLCPNVAANREQEKQAMVELASKFDLDGVHFDFMRYPEPVQPNPNAEFCFCDTCRAKFESVLGRKVDDWPRDCLKTGKLYESYLQFRRDTITSSAQEIVEAVRAANPHIKISLSAWPSKWWWNTGIMQDWPLWIQRGYLDFVVPMSYTTDDSRFRTMTQQQIGWAAGKVPLYAGIGGFVMDSPTQLSDQVEISRQCGADGFVVFSWSTLKRWLPDLRLGATRGDPGSPHLAPPVSFELPAAAATSETGYAQYAAGSQITAQIRLDKDSPSHLSARLVVESPDGVPLVKLGELKLSAGNERSVQFNVPTGPWRMALYGTAATGRQRAKPFVTRGPLCEGIERAPS